ncbi:MAG: nucleoside triphosphate pyrophosphohydrolase [bacterium]|nr:nucleoside triphosphate pyrophosphohydrolase [bacterium]
MRIFKKLIRDKMPEIMAKEDKMLEVRVLGGDEFKEALRRKIIEEVQELKDAKDDAEAKDKIAYLHEIADALGDAYGFSKKEILELKDKTRALRGGFEKRLFLEGEKK